MYFLIDKVTNKHESTALTLAEIAQPLPDRLKIIDVGAIDLALNYLDEITSTVKPIPIPPDVITPVVSKMQAAAWLKTFFETDPTSWSATDWNTQLRYAVYALLLAEFRNFKSGRVY